MRCARDIHSTAPAAPTGIHRTKDLTQSWVTVQELLPGGSKRPRSRRRQIARSRPTIDNGDHDQPGSCTVIVNSMLCFSLM